MSVLVPERVETGRVAPWALRTDTVDSPTADGHAESVVRAADGDDGSVVDGHRDTVAGEPDDGTTTGADA